MRDDRVVASGAEENFSGGGVARNKKGEGVLGSCRVGGGGEIALVVVRVDAEGEIDFLEIFLAADAGAFIGGGFAVVHDQDGENHHDGNDTKQFEQGKSRARSLENDNVRRGQIYTLKCARNSVTWQDGWKAPDQLWKEYIEVFEEFDDLTLARWVAQTLAQLHGRCLAGYSHPLIGAYRLAAEAGHPRQIWLKRLATIPAGFTESPCCRAPSLPLFTRDILTSGLICEHCGETLTPFEELPASAELQTEVREWVRRHMRRSTPLRIGTTASARAAGDYDKAFEEAATQAERLLIVAGTKLALRFLDHYPAIVWEDQDECLEVRPEDLE